MISVTVDAVVFTKRENIGDGYSVLMVRRKNEPFQGQLALPGGFLNERESLMQGALRELEEETGLRLFTMRQHRVYGAPDRDPRGHVVSVVYTAQLDRQVPVVGRDDAAEALWVPIEQQVDGDFLNEKFAFDHGLIVRDCLRDSRSWQGDFAKVEDFARS